MEYFRMNIVYLITFTDRLNRNLKPYYYVGSKSNCNIIDGKIVSEKNNRVYYGSSRSILYKQLISDNEPFIVTVLDTADVFKELLEKELFWHKKLNVVESNEYFNKSMAIISNFSDSEYANYRHIDSGKIVRLHINDEELKTGKFVGITKGVPCKNPKSRGLCGEKNPFFGKSHTKESKDKISESLKGRKLTNDTKMKMSKQRIGILKSESHKENIGKANKGKITLKNKHTLEVIRIDRTLLYEYDESVWLNPNSKHFIKPIEIKCEYCQKIVTSKGNYVRWHGQNCKEYKNANIKS